MSAASATEYQPDLPSRGLLAVQAVRVVHAVATHVGAFSARRNSKSAAEDLGCCVQIRPKHGCGTGPMQANCDLSTAIYLLISPQETGNRKTRIAVQEDSSHGATSSAAQAAVTSLRILQTCWSVTVRGEGWAPATPPASLRCPAAHPAAAATPLAGCRTSARAAAAPAGSKHLRMVIKFFGQHIRFRRDFVVYLSPSLDTMFHLCRRMVKALWRLCYSIRIRRRRRRQQRGGEVVAVAAALVHEGDHLRHAPLSPRLSSRRRTHAQRCQICAWSRPSYGSLEGAGWCGDARTVSLASLRRGLCNVVKSALGPDPATAASRALAGVAMRAPYPSTSLRRGLSGGPLTATPAVDLSLTSDPKKTPCLLTPAEQRWLSAACQLPLAALLLGRGSVEPRFRLD